MLRKWCTQNHLVALLLGVALSVASTGVSAMAQTSGAGSITGTVMDAKQSVIPGASVTVTNVDTGVDDLVPRNVARVGSGGDRSDAQAAQTRRLAIVKRRNLREGDVVDRLLISSRRLSGQSVILISVQPVVEHPRAAAERRGAVAK